MTHRIPLPTNVAFTFFSNTLRHIDSLPKNKMKYLESHKASPNIFRRNKIMKIIIFDYSVIKLEINDRKIIRKSPEG